jgi:2-hydroxy-3-keto-5-methylthiopentenyl-1-phosphate phosphatase
MIKISEVIKVNISCILKNAICFYFWDGKPIEGTIEKAIERYSTQMYGIEKDISNKDIMVLFYKYIDKAKKDCYFIVKNEIDTSISPKIKNFKDFVTNEQIPFKNIAEMQNFIIEHF